MSPSIPSRSFPIIATLLTILGTIILCSLGTWQLYRLTWKAQIIANLDKAYNADISETLNLNSPENFIAGKITGNLSDTYILLGPRVHQGKVGTHVIAPLMLPNGTTLLINFGWTDNPKPHITAQTTTFTGIARRPNISNFTPENMPEKNQWYRADIQEIATHLKAENPHGFILYANETEFTPHEKIYPNNNHAQYAAFWFIMALALISIYYLRFWRN